MSQLVLIELVKEWEHDCVTRILSVTVPNSKRKGEKNRFKNGLNPIFVIELGESVILCFWIVKTCFLMPWVLYVVDCTSGPGAGCTCPCGSSDGRLYLGLGQWCHLCALTHLHRPPLSSSDVNAHFLWCPVGCELAGARRLWGTIWRDYMLMGSSNGGRPCVSRVGRWWKPLRLAHTRKIHFTSATAVEVTGWSASLSQMWLLKLKAAFLYCAL